MKQANSVGQTKDTLMNQAESQKQKPADKIAGGPLVIKQVQRCNALGVKEEERCFLLGYN